MSGLTRSRRIVVVLGAATVIAASGAAAHTAAGSIALADLRGEARASTTNGDIVVHRHRGSVTATAVTGDVSVDAVDAPSLTAATDVGTVWATAILPPDHVSARTSHGDITIGVPPDVGYAVRTEGDLAAAISVQDDPASPHRIEAITANGVVAIFTHRRAASHWH